MAAIHMRLGYMYNIVRFLVRISRKSALNLIKTHFLHRKKQLLENLTILILGFEFGYITQRLSKSKRKPGKSRHKMTLVSLHSKDFYYKWKFQHIAAARFHVQKKVRNCKIITYTWRHSGAVSRNLTTMYMTQICVYTP